MLITTIIKHVVQLKPSEFTVSGLNHGHYLYNDGAQGHTDKMHNTSNIIICKVTCRSPGNVAFHHKLKGKNHYICKNHTFDCILHLHLCI